MADKIKSGILLGLIFLLANTVPVISLSLGIMSQAEVINIYWLEGGFLAVSAVLFYAKQLAVFFALLFGALFLIYVYYGIPGGDLRIPLTFWCLYTLCWLGYTRMPLSRSRIWRRKQSTLA